MRYCHSSSCYLVSFWLDPTWTTSDSVSLPQQQKSMCKMIIHYIKTKLLLNEYKVQGQVKVLKNKFKGSKLSATQSEWVNSNSSNL